MTWMHMLSRCHQQQGKVHRKYRVTGSLGGLVKGRKTFVIDKEGTIVYIFESALNWQKHVSEALEHC
jgi:peroxiredoxin Q/BCP